MVEPYVKTRIQTLFHSLEKPVDAIIIKNATQPFTDSTFFYVTGLEQGLFEGSLALLYPDGSADLVISELEAETAKNTQSSLHIYKTKTEAEQLIKQLTSSLHHIGVHFQGLLHRDFCSLQNICTQVTFQDISPAITQTRLIKDTQELKHLTHACRIADRVMNDIPSLLNKNMHEYELAAEINYRLEKYGAEKPAFTTISTFGKNTAEPHYSHGETTLQPGDFVLCDFGACVHGYNSDMTRTFVYGKGNQKQQEMHQTVLQAQSKGLTTIRPGVPASEVHHAVASYIDSTPFKGLFIHSTGHSLGLSVHDGPGFATDSTLLLKENMVLTVEPGIYIPGYGGVRIEDDILVTKNGATLLTQSSREYTEIS